MAQKVLVKDSDTGAIVASATNLSDLGGGGGNVVPTYYKFDVPEGGEDTFNVDHLLVGTIVRATINGQEVREGLDDDFTKDVETGDIIFNYTVPEGCYVLITLFNTVSYYTYFDFEVEEPTSSFELTTDVAPGSDIFVLVNGEQYREGAGSDYLRNVNGDSIDFAYNIPAGANVRVAIK